MVFIYQLQFYTFFYISPQAVKVTLGILPGNTGIYIYNIPNFFHFIQFLSVFDSVSGP